MIFGALAAFAAWAGTAGTIAAVNLAITAVSMAYQITQAKKAQSKAAEAAEARKGFEAVVEAISTDLPIVYGRAKVGGVRVWHNTRSSLTLGAPNADKVISNFTNLVEQNSTTRQSFTHPGTDNIRVNYNATVLAELASSTRNGAIAFYADVVTQTFEGGEGQYSISTNTVGVPPSWVVTLISEDATGFNVTIKNGTSAALTGWNMQFMIPLSKVVGELVGTKNEFLVYQQALCQGPINQVYDVIIDDSRYYNDPAISDAAGNTGPTKKGIRFECYHTGGIPHNNVALNFSDRRDAKFSKLASVSVFVKLDRDDQQFSDIPNCSFFIEGRKMKTVSLSGGNPVLSSTLSYSNNPAFCMLDYLMDTTCGKGLSVDEIDLKSFYDASLVCAKIVQTNVVVGGKIWQPTDGARNVTRRDLPLYECNIMLDVTKPVRANVESILSTMGDARLVWSGGKYKLKLQYPSA